VVATSTDSRHRCTKQWWLESTFRWGGERPEPSTFTGAPGERSTFTRGTEAIYARHEGEEHVCTNSKGKPPGHASSEGKSVGRTVCTLRGLVCAWCESVRRGRLQFSQQRLQLQTYPAPSGAHGFAGSLMPPLPPGPTADPCALLGSHRRGVWVLERAGPSARHWARHGTPGTAELAPNRRASGQQLCATLGGQGPTEGDSRGHWCCARRRCSSPQRVSGSSAHAHTRYTHTRREHPTHTPRCARDGVLSGTPQAHPHPPAAALSTAVPAHAGGSPHPAAHIRACGETPMHLPCAPHPSLPGQHSNVLLATRARKPVGRACCGPAPFPSPQKTHSNAPPAPVPLTVNMLERRFDCLRIGVGVLEAAMVSIRSSRWLMLGVEGTEEE